MKKSSSTTSAYKVKKKKQHAPCLRYFGFAGAQEVDGKEHRCKIEGGKKLKTYFCIGYNNAFKSDQGQGDHERACALAQQHFKEK